MSRLRSSPSRRENFRNRCGSRSAAIPLPSSVTETATWYPSRTAVTPMADASWEYRAALVRRLFSTWMMRRPSAMTSGSSGERSMRRLFLPPPLWNLLLASSTRVATSAGAGATDSSPVSMRATSSRSPIRSRMWSACSPMMRKNWSISAGSRSEAASVSVAAEPLMEVSGVLSSWLTMPRNSARRRSISSSGVMSCRVTTTETTSPSSERMAALFNLSER